MNQSQHGFRAGRSTITQLLSYYDDILTKIEEGKCVDSIYLDFSKAFDKVDHQILLRKMESLNIGGKLLQWVANFLKNRQQIVKVEYALSEPVWVKSGVPQGSVMGPLLFLILMIDINKDVTYAALGSFADDTRMWEVISEVHKVNDLQQDLHTVYSWADTNNMEFNGDKFEGMRFGQHESTFTYTTPQGKEIERKEHVKDLGIMFEQSLVFTMHIKKCSCQGAQDGRMGT